MQADFARRCMAQGVVASMFAAFLVVVGPATTTAQAAPNPCNLPGGHYVCKKAVDGAEWIDENVPGVHEAGEAIDSAIDTAGSVVDFASDPLGYLEGKLRDGTKGMFSAFGEERTGKKPSAPKRIARRGKGD